MAERQSDVMLGLFRRSPAPDEECIEKGAKYVHRIGRGWAELRDENDIVRWRYDVRRKRSNWGWRNPFNKAEFRFGSPEGYIKVVIRRAWFLPPVFEIVQGDSVAGRIRMTSPLRNRYRIDIWATGRWTFVMPLFTALFYGKSKGGIDIWVGMGPECQWSILIRPGVERAELVAAVAFIHRERWLYG
jgi:hypothetical protein